MRPLKALRAPADRLADTVDQAFDVNATTAVRLGICLLVVAGLAGALLTALMIALADAIGLAWASAAQEVDVASLRLSRRCRST